MFAARSWQRWLPRVRRGALLILVLATALLALQSSVKSPATTAEGRAHAYTRSIEFDYTGWMLGALRLKFLETALGAHNYLTAEERHTIVRQYMQLVLQIQRSEYELRSVYANPEVKDPERESEELRRELQTLYAMRDKVAPVAEGTLQQQTNAIAAELGLTAAGQTLPPVLYHSTPLPLALIISQRDVIRREGHISLLPDVSIDQQVALEAQVDKSLNVSSLVEPVGGIGVYPTMVAQTSNLNWLSEVVAHEWIHNYLDMRPLGWNYMTSDQLRIMNETTASIAGIEMGRLLIERYYPELLPPKEPQQSSPAPREPQQPPEFSFNKEMHTTRVTVDALLAEGKIEEAEAYMEQRRQVFWEQGYQIRKLNQAYFAFHGAYADEPLSAAGEDPVGAAVRKLRAQSSSLQAFLQTIAWMDSFEQLQQAVQ
ncbi:MAG: hypothetical protein ACKOC5_09275 [Chloroflexota bacterium]